MRNKCTAEASLTSGSASLIEMTSLLPATQETRAIYSITPFTLLDFPGKTACILWFAGCNMRCSYCYNPAIVTGKGKIDYLTALGFIRSRKGLLDGVVLSGGEATQHKDIVSFAALLREENYLVKLDTNGSRPAVIKQLLKRNCLDYVALDFKAPPEKFTRVTQSNLYKEFEETLQLLIHHNIAFEVRTTVHSSLLSKPDIQQMVEYLAKQGYSGTYYLQNYVGTSDTLGRMKDSSDKICQEAFLGGIPVRIR